MRDLERRIELDQPRQALDDQIICSFIVNAAKDCFRLEGLGEALDLSLTLEQREPAKLAPTLPEYTKPTLDRLAVDGGLK